MTITGRFVGKAALLSAAASGIGAATARRLAAEGARVFLTDVDDSAASRVVEEIRNSGGMVHYHRCDVTDADQWADAVAAMVEWTGHIDVLHLNAGANLAGTVEELAPQSWASQLRFSLDSAFFGLHAAIGPIRASGGSIVFTSSIHAHVGFRSFPVYAVAKGGLEALVRQLAVEYGPEGVRVNAVAPGAVLTSMWTDTPDTYRNQTISFTPLRRLGLADDIAAAVAFLASSDAAFITGQTLLVDGGRSISSHE